MKANSLSFPFIVLLLICAELASRLYEPLKTGPALLRERDRGVRKGLEVGQNIGALLWVFLAGIRHLGA
jgi:hypothetical protein